ncbi:MAG: hypothetical protein Q4E99_05680 [Bacillota bacterium]|nr:hypothetical protein [Bacillota bacterium]
MNTKGKVAIAFFSGVGVTTVACVIYNKTIFNKAIEKAVEQVLTEEGRTTVLEAADSVLEEEGDESDMIKVEDYESKPVTRNPDPNLEPLVQEIEVEKDVDREGIAKVNEISAQEKYVSSFDAAKKRLDDIKEGGVKDRISIINPEEFGVIPEYDTIFCTSYADQIVADDDGEVIVDIEESVSSGALDLIQNYVTEIVYVRNDTEKCYYQIVSDKKRFADLDEDED